MAFTLIVVTTWRRLIFGDQDTQGQLGSMTSRHKIAALSVGLAVAGAHPLPQLLHVSTCGPPEQAQNDNLPRDC